MVTNNPELKLIAPFQVFQSQNRTFSYLCGLELFESKQET